MKEINATDAKAHLAELLRAVERGESFAITRHGKPVARLVPANAAEERAAALEKATALRDGLPRVKISLAEILAWRHEGHRY